MRNRNAYWLHFVDQVSFLVWSLKVRSNLFLKSSKKEDPNKKISYNQGPKKKLKFLHINELLKRNSNYNNNTT